MTKSTILLLLFLTLNYLCNAQGKPIILYPNGIPNSKKTPADYIELTDSNGYITKVSEPSLIPFYPANSIVNGTAVIICPGGGYQMLVASDEGSDIARAFNKLGVIAFVLKYRLPNDDIMIDRTIGPLQDAQMAVLLLRKRASELKINPDKIGIVGLSAGGHLASTEGTRFEIPLIENNDHISLRPDFMILIYPAITLGPLGPRRSRANLLGKTPTPEAFEFFSNEKHVTANTPPTFLVHATDDDIVPVQNSLMFYDALIKAKVKVEMHIFQDGGHGFGLDNPNRKDKWMDWCNEWMKENNFGG